MAADRFLDTEGLRHLWEKIKAWIPFLSRKTQSIPFGQVDSTSTATVFTATVDGIDELRDGVCCYLRNGVVTSASGFTININGLGAKPVYNTMASATALTTHFNINYTMLFIYNSTRVSGGCWDMYVGYDTNSTYNLNTNYTTIGRINVGAYPLSNYSLCAFDINDKLTPFVTTATTSTGKTLVPSVFPIGAKIYSSNYAQAANTSFNDANYLLTTVANQDLRYSSVNHNLAIFPNNTFNRIFMPVIVDVEHNTFTLTTQTTNGYTNNFTNERSLKPDNFYIEIGFNGKYDYSYYYTLIQNNPLYYYDGTRLIEYSIFKSSIIDVPEYTIEKLAQAETGYASSYVLKKDNVQVGATINIPKDMVVSSGEVKTVTVADEPYQGAVVGDKYIDLTIANTAQNHIYIPVKDLVDVYIAGNGIQISDNNYISVKVNQNQSNGLGVGYDGVSMYVVTPSINGVGGTNGSMLATDKEKLDGIETGADVNVIETVKVSGTALQVTNKAVNIETETAYDPTTNKIATMSDVTGATPNVGHLKTDNTTALTPSASESFTGNISLHKVSKTGSYKDLNDKLVAGQDIEIVHIGNNLPEGYTELEYIESTETQYINTGITGGAGLSVDMVVQGTGDKGIIFSFDQDYTGSYVGDNGTDFRGPYVFTGISSLVKTDITTYWESEDSKLKQTTTINGVTKTYNMYSRTPSTIELFKGRSWNVADSFWAGKIFSFLLKRNGVAIRNFIPAKNSNNVVGMYDLVSGQFFTNAGTGSFVAGPVVSIVGEVINFVNDDGFITSSDLPSPADTAPLMDGTSAVGTSTDYAREDHVHPTDTTRAPLASPSFSGVPTAPTAAAGTNTTQIATTAFVQSATNGMAIDTNVVHKTGNETIAGVKTFTNNVKAQDADIIFETKDGDKHTVGISLDSQPFEQAEYTAGALRFSDITLNGVPVLLKNILNPIETQDAATKGYVDSEIENIKGEKVRVQGWTGQYGMSPYSLVAFAKTSEGMVLTSFTTTGGTGQKTPVTSYNFPIGSKIYFYNSEDSAATAGTLWEIYTQFRKIDARYSAITGENVSLGTSASLSAYYYTTSVFLRVSIDGEYWKPYYKDGSTTEIIVSIDQLVSGNYYIYLGRTTAEWDDVNHRYFQLEDNNPLYYYDGTNLVDWATRLKTIIEWQSTQDMSLKADKVEEATSGNLAGLDYTGNLTDSGLAADEVATLGTNQLTNYYKKTEIYSKSETDALVRAASDFEYEEVSTLPTASASTKGKFYLYNGHRYVTTEKAGGVFSWVDLGSYDIDLSGYVTNSTFEEAMRVRPEHQEVTEAQLRSMLDNETWEENVVYYTVEEE